MAAGRSTCWKRPLQQHAHPVAQRHRLLVVLGDVEDGGLELLEQPRQLQPHLVAQLGVDVAQRVVEQQDLGPAHQRPAQRRALLLPVRELARQVVQHVGYAQELGHLLHALLDVGLVHPAGAERARDVLEAPA